MKKFLLGLLISLSALAITQVNGLNQDEMILKAVAQNKLIVFKYTAEWCGACHAMEETLKVVEKKYGNKIAIFEMDVDENRPFLPKTLRYLPTVGIFKSLDDKDAIFIEGFRTVEQLEQLIDSKLAK
jgi:thioredoxin 1